MVLCLRDDVVERSQLHLSIEEAKVSGLKGDVVGFKRTEEKCSRGLISRTNTHRAAAVASCSWRRR